MEIKDFLLCVLKKCETSDGNKGFPIVFLKYCVTNVVTNDGNKGFPFFCVERKINGIMRIDCEM